MNNAANDYDALSAQYVKTHEKPDKKYSMLPTMLRLLEVQPTHTVVDVGCGDGFFTREIAKKAHRVIGIDNSSEQIAKATVNQPENVHYRVANMFDFDYPACESISCPFVPNYVKSPQDLAKLFTTFNQALSADGRLVCLIDMPTQLVNDRKQWGAIKRVHGSSLKEGASMDIELYNGEEHLVTLHSNYHERGTIENSLRAAGFKGIHWKMPIVSQAGIAELGLPFWKEYMKRCDVAYIVAEKKLKSFVRKRKKDAFDI